MADKKETTTKVEVEEEKVVDPRDAKIEALEAQLAKLMQMMEDSKKAPAAQPVTPTIQLSAPTTDVTLVYLDNCPGLIKCGDIKIKATKMNEEFVLSRSQFDIVVGKYRRWFDDGILAVGDQDYEVAIKKGLKTASEYTLNIKELERLGTMTPAELKKFWNSLKTQAHKIVVVTYFKRKFIEGAPGYRDRDRLDMLDSLTDGAFDRERSELLGKFYIERTVVSLKKDDE